jgi:hypothetical protein
MGCLSRSIVLLAVVVQVGAAALALVVLGSAGVLGSAAVINSNDALIVFIAVACSLLATFVLTMKIWLGSRKRKRLEAQLRALQSPVSPTSPPYARESSC